VLAFVYVFMLAIAKSTFTGDSGRAWIGVWLPNLLFTVVAGLWLWRVPK